MRNLKQAAIAASLLLAGYAMGQGARHVEMAKVESKPVTRTVPLTAELQPFLQADIEARVPGYIQRVLVDRGSLVHRGELLVQLSAPEMEAQTSAAQAAFQEAKAQESQAEAQAAAATATYERMQEAAKTPGAVAGNELTQAQKQKEAADAVVESRKAALATASNHMKATEEMQSYLELRAPFEGVITDRFVHPGMMVEANSHEPLLKLQQVAHLRLVVPVPETYVGAIQRGMAVKFTVPARPGKTYSAPIARVAKALDQQTRAMMVELDVTNRDGFLAPGMYPTVAWPVSSGGDVLLVPATSVVTTTERTFVITSQNGRAHWVDVHKGAASGDQVSVRGDLRAGEMVVRRASDEMREGSVLH